MFVIPSELLQHISEVPEVPLHINLPRICIAGLFFEHRANRAVRKSDTEKAERIQSKFQNKTKGKQLNYIAYLLIVEELKSSKNDQIKTH